MQRPVAALEYLYETSLVPAWQRDRYILTWQKRDFLRRLALHLSMLKHKRNPAIDIIDAHDTGNGSAQPRVVHLIVWLGGIGGGPRLILDIVNGLKHKYHFEEITISTKFYFKYSNFVVHHFHDPPEMLSFLAASPPENLACAGVVPTPTPLSGIRMAQWHLHQADGHSPIQHVAPGRLLPDFVSDKWQDLAPYREIT